MNILGINFLGPDFLGANFFALLFSLILLWWAGEWVVRYGLIASRLFGYSRLFVGFVLLAVATGLPELSVALLAFFRGASGLGAGDIVGSNFVDISLVLGLPALIVSSIYVPRAEKQVLMGMLGVTSYVMAVVFCLGRLHPWHSILLIPVFFIAMWLLWQTRHAKEVVEDKFAQVKEKRQEEIYLPGKGGTLVKLAASLSLLLVASQLVVYFAIAIAHDLKLSLEIIGSTFVAVGTSLPELTISIQSCRRKEYSLALGNSFGSVLEQGSLILGILALISPQPIDITPLYHIIPFMFSAFGIVAFGIGVRNKINRFEGAALVFLFCAYWVYAFGRSAYAVWL
jgi:cation:H+ antiporter